MKLFTSETQKTGELGESIACIYLENKGYTIMDRNFTKAYGEIDIIAQKGIKAHFIEVKSVSRENIRDFSRETDEFRPEDQMHAQKQMRLMRTISVYLETHTVKDWQFDLICVYLNRETRQARVKMIEDVILEGFT